MSRIIGFLSAGSQQCDTSRFEAALSRLSGAQTLTTIGHDAALAWKGGRGDAAGRLFATKSLKVVVDGYILNRAELCAQFSISSDDAGLIAALYRRYGFEAALRRLAGDFAIALYDAETGMLWLGRDRFGVRPLYYATLPSGNFAFASQPSPLLALGAPINPERGFVARFAGLHYRMFDNVAGNAPYEGMAQLPAAHFVAGTTNKIGPVRAYWRLTEQPDWPDSEEVLAERYRALLQVAVARRLAVAGRAVFTLSGGLDSSSILCSAAAIRKEKQCAVSTVYVDATFDERHEIANVVDEKVSQWIPIEIANDIDIVNVVSSMIRAHDEPVATATWLSYAVLTKNAAAAGFDSIFGGLGGDELNAGEYEYFPMFFADLRASGRVATLDAEIEFWARYHDHPIFRKNRAIAEDAMTRMIDATTPGRCLPDYRRMLRYADTIEPTYYDLSGFVPIMESPFTSYLKTRTYQDIVRETLPCCLRAEDRQCAAMGLRHFDPFLDHELVEFMYRVPGTMKIRGGVTKWLLRGAMKGLLPEATRVRIKKTGWNAPAHRWFSGRTLEMLRDRVVSQRFRNRGIYRPDRVIAIINDHARIVENRANEDNHMMFLWQLLNLELWFDQIDEFARVVA